MTGFLMTGFVTQKCVFIRQTPSCFSNKWYTVTSKVSMNPHAKHSYHSWGSLAGAFCVLLESMLSSICNTWSHVVARGQAIQTILTSTKNAKTVTIFCVTYVWIHRSLDIPALAALVLLGMWRLDVRPESSVLWSGEVLSRRRPPL